MINGRIFNIQRFCTDDGPGIRTTVFFKGCPLRCLWCHNPESQKKDSEITYDESKCIACGRCVTVCPTGSHTLTKKHIFERESCNGCGACSEVCPSQALELFGKTASVQEIYYEVRRDKIFYDTSGGGVTLSGGEPLYQPKLATALLKRCKEGGIHTAIETCGFADETALLSVLEYCDLVLFDIKETDSERHKRYTGAPLEPILRNLGMINERKIPFIIRAPIIPDLNDREEHFSELRKIRDALEYCGGIEIMPYHKTGSYKYALLDRDYSLSDIEAPSKETAERWRTLV